MLLLIANSFKSNFFFIFHQDVQVIAFLDDTAPIYSLSNLLCCIFVWLSKWDVTMPSSQVSTLTSVACVVGIPQRAS